MATINNSYINALLADASYVQLSANGIVFDDSSLLSSLSNRLTSPLAESLLSNFDILSQELSVDNGFDAVVWRGKSSTQYAGKVYVSIRGTQGLQDGLDDGDLAATGLAHQQIVSMVNWWLRETTPEGEYAMQIGIRSAGIPGLPVSLQDFVPAASVTGTGRLSNVGAIESVNGHSLGGYMASSFVRLFGAKWPVTSLSTFNSAGFSTLATANIERGFNQIANILGSASLITFAAENQINYFAENGINVTTNTWRPIGFRQYGDRIPIFQEDGAGFPPISNHYMFKLTDVLALGAVLEKLDPSMNIERLNLIAQAGSNIMSDSYEGVLDNLRRMLLGPNITPTQTSDESSGNTGQSVERIDYHNNLKAFADSQNFNFLAALGQEGKLAVKFGNDSDLASRARTDFGAMLALDSLSTLFISSTDDDAVEFLKGLNPSLAQRWEADATSRASGQTPQYFSDQWLEDRAALLSKKIMVNNNDYDPKQVQIGIHYEDGEQAYTLGADGILSRRVIFGSDAADEIAGSMRDDHIYGGGGSDSIETGAGADYVEGGQGNDTITTGDGSDTIYGGAGTDTLNGGKGNDTLDGGAGYDTYLFSTGDGTDSVNDSDGQGQIVFEGSALNGGKKTSGNKYQSADGQYRYSFVGDLVAGGTLVINDRIVIRSFHNNDLGIALDLSASEQATPTYQIQYVGGPEPTNHASDNASYGFFLYGSDFNDRYIAASYDPSQEDAPPVPGGAAGVFFGKAGDDLFEGSYIHGGDQALGGPGNDILLGAAVGMSLPAAVDEGMGGDLLDGAAGQDTVIGSDLNDALFGDGSGFGGTISSYTDFSFYLFGMQIAGYSNQNSVSVYPAFGPNNGIRWYGATVGSFPTAMDAFNYVLGISAGSNLDSLYDDYVDGGGGDDRIVGGSGSDVLIGGDGNDEIIGDYDRIVYANDPADPLFFRRSQANFGEYAYLLGKPGDDYLDGGDGNDTLSDLFGGSDQLYGGAGDDVLGNDDSILRPEFYQDGVVPDSVSYVNLLDGGEGDDLIISDSEHFGSFDQIFGGTGNDTIEFTGYSAFIDGGEGDDDINAEGSDLTDFSGVGADIWITGGDGDDYICAAASNLEVTAGAGSDTLVVSGGEIRIDQAGRMAGDVDSLYFQFDSSVAYWEHDGADLVITDFSGNTSVTIVGWFEGFEKQFDTIAFSDGTPWTPADIVEELASVRFSPSGENDLIYASADHPIAAGLDGEDRIFSDIEGVLVVGGEGDDAIHIGNEGSDLIIGGHGNDLVTSYGTANVFAFNRGDGQDVLKGFAGTISLGGIAFYEVSISNFYSENDVGLSFDFGQGDSLTLINPAPFFFDGEEDSGTQSPLLLQVVLPTRVDVYDLLSGDSSAQSSLDSAIGGILAYEYALHGSTSALSGDAIVAALGEADFGSAAQTLDLERSLNEYLYQPGDGVQILSKIEGIDAVRFGLGVAQDDLKLELGSLAIRVGDSGDVLHLENFNPGDAFGVHDFERFEFSDGSSLTYSELLQRGFDLDGTAGDDTIAGTNTTDRIDGKGGDDLLAGGLGSDTYFFGLGSGHDQIVEAPSLSDQDILRIFGNPDEVKVARDGDNLVIGLKQSDDRIAVNWYADPSARIESVVFDDNTIWNAIGLESMANAPVNHAPLLAMPISDQTAQEDAIFHFAVPADTFIEPDGDALTYSATLANGNALPDWLWFDAATGGFSGTPANENVGALSLRVTASDTGALSEHDDFNVVVQNVNDAPLAANDTGAAQEDGGAVTLESATLLANDTDPDAGDTKVIVAVTNSTAGAAVSLTGGNVAYNPGELFQTLQIGATATDSFTYTMADAVGATSTATVLMTIAGIDDTPAVANPIPDQNATVGNPFIFSVAANTFSDMDSGDVLAYSATLTEGTALPSWLNFNAATRTFSGTSPGSAGTLQLRVNATDTSGASACDVFALNITGDANAGRIVIGTDGEDVLTGTAFNDIIDGRRGHDVMFGGKGDDVFYVDRSRAILSDRDGEHFGRDAANTHGGNSSNDSSCPVDEVIEKVNEGYDSVYSLADYTLTANVEELHLLGEEGLAGHGNALDNIVVGGTGDNALFGEAGDDLLLDDAGEDRLDGGAGNDVLDGGAGNDTLIGGVGDDTFVHALGGGDDEVQESGGQDAVRFGDGIVGNALGVSRRQNDLLLKVSGNNGSVTLKNWFGSAANRVEKVQFADGTGWNEAQMRARVGQTATVIPGGVLSSGTAGDHGYSQPDAGGGGADHHGDEQDDHRKIDRRDVDREGDPDNSAARDARDAIATRLERDPHYDFTALAVYLSKRQGAGHGALTAAQVAQQWRQVQDRVGLLAQDDDDARHNSGSGHHDANDHTLVLGAAQWGYAGSVGKSRGAGGMAGFAGLSEGFKRLG